MRQYISKELTDSIFKHYPNLANQASYRKLFLRLIFSNVHGEGYSIIGNDVLANCEGCFNLFKSKNYNGTTFLTNFIKDTGVSLQIRGYDYVDKRARQATIILPTELQEVLDSEIDRLLSRDKFELFNFITGTKMNKNSLTAIKKKLDEEILLFYDNASEEALPLLEYLNNLPSNLFSAKLKENEDILISTLQSLESSETDPKLKPYKDALLRGIEARVIIAMRENPKPYYKPSSAGRTVRIFPHNLSLLLLHKSLRKVACKGWHEYDLVSSQLAIVAKLWSITEVQKFLQSGNHIWTELITHLGFNYSLLKQQKPAVFDKLKALLKESLYSLIYGMKKSALLARLTKGFHKLGIKKKGSDLFTHSIMAALFVARENKIAKVLEEGHILLDWHNNKVLTLEGKTKQERLKNVKSLLAQEAQLMEMVLILPVFEIAKQNSQYMSIVLFQHDGFTVHYNKANLINSLESKMIEAVRAQANLLKVDTNLEGGVVN